MSATLNTKATMQYYKVMKNSGNMSSPKDNNNSPKTHLKGMEFCDLRDKKFKIAVLTKFNKQQGNSEIQFNKIRGKYMNKMRYSPKK